MEQRPFSEETPPPVMAPTLPSYGPPLAHPQQAKPLQKIIGKMFKLKTPKVRANRHPRQLRKKQPFY